MSFHVFSEITKYVIIGTLWSGRKVKIVRSCIGVVDINCTSNQRCKNREHDWCTIHNIPYTYSLSTHTPAAGLHRCPLARPAGRTEKTARLWAERRARIFVLLPWMLRRMPTCSRKGYKFHWCLLKKYSWPILLQANNQGDRLPRI